MPLEYLEGCSRSGRPPGAKVEGGAGIELQIVYQFIYVSTKCNFNKHALSSTQMRKILLPLNRTQLAKYTFTNLGMIAKRKKQSRRRENSSRPHAFHAILAPNHISSMISDVWKLLRSSG